MLHTLSREIFRCAFLEQWQLPISAITKPPDFTRPALEMSIYPKGDVTNYEQLFKVTYVGDKYIRFYVGANKELWNESYGGSGYTPKLRFRLKIWCNGKVIWSEENSKGFNPRTFSFQDKVLGYTLAKLNCPRDIPLDSVLHLSIDVLQTDSYFLENGPLKIEMINFIRE